MRNAAPIGVPHRGGVWYCWHRRQRRNAYVVSPGADNPDAPYRTRVGGYPSREAASSAAARLGRLRGEKLWVIPE